MWCARAGGEHLVSGFLPFLFFLCPSLSACGSPLPVPLWSLCLSESLISVSLLLPTCHVVGHPLEALVLPDCTTGSLMRGLGCTPHHVIAGRTLGPGSLSSPFLLTLRPSYGPGGTEGWEPRPLSASLPHLPSPLLFPWAQGGPSPAASGAGVLKVAPFLPSAHPTQRGRAGHCNYMWLRSASSQPLGPAPCLSSCLAVRLRPIILLTPGL